MPSFAQKETLLYYCNKDSTLVGVKTAQGKIIIPAAYHSYGVIPGEKVRGNSILLWDTIAHIAADSMHYTHSLKVFNRKGDYLYTPYFFDNGPDYYVEGLRRYVDNGKMGMVDRNGNKVIEAKYNYLHNSYGGYILACLDCRYTRFSKDEEHCCGYTGTKYAIIDRTGNPVSQNTGLAFSSLNDSVLKALKLVPAYTGKEKSIIALLSEQPAIKQYCKDHGERYIGTILARPKDKNDYYLVAFRNAEGNWDSELSFLFRDAKTIRHLNSSTGEPESLRQWQP